MLSQADVKGILDTVLSYSKADEAEASLTVEEQGNIRFARNIPTTSGENSGIDLTITCMFGKRVGTSSTTQTDERSLREAVRRAEELARLSPENPEYMPRLGPQTYAVAPAWDDATMKLGAESRAKVAAEAIEVARGRDLVAAGYYQNRTGCTAVANKKGLFAYHPSTSASYTLTVRTPDGTGSGWAAAESFRAGAVDSSRITARAIEKAVASQKPAQIEPRAYPVILEPSAAADFVKLYRWNLDRRSADEGRSFFSDPEHGTRIGQKIFDDRITIYSDPLHPLVPSRPWDDDAQPIGRTVWAEKGVQRNLAVGRFWAQKKGLQPLPGGTNVIMEGEDHSLEDLIAATDYGLLITSSWYIRQVDPKTILYTGLTRDGVFLVEKGKIVRPVINLRWNESPIAVFKNVEMMSRPERVVTREGNQPMLVPALKLKSFTFTSASSST